MYTTFLRSLTISLLCVSFASRAAQASIASSESFDPEGITLVLTSGTIFDPRSCGIREKPEKIMLGIPAERSFAKAGGLNGAVHTQAGAELASACAQLITDNDERNYPVGAVGCTPSFNLSHAFKYIAHAAAPRALGADHPAYCATVEEQDARMIDCYRNMCLAARQRGVSTLITVFLGTGPVAGFTVERSATNLVKAIESIRPEAVVKQLYIVASDEQRIMALAAIEAYKMQQITSALGTQKLE